MPQNRSTLTRGYAIALVSAFILSTTAIIIRYLVQTYHIPPLVLAFWREVFVTLTLFPVLGIVRPCLLQLERRHALFLIVFGLVLAIFNALWTISVYLNGAAIATVLVYCSAVFTALLGWWLLDERLDGVKLLAIALCLGGCVLVSGALNPDAWRANLLGILTGVLSGLGYALYSLMGRSASMRGLNPWTTLFYTFGFATLFLLVFNLTPEGLIPGAAAHPSDLLWLGNALTGWVILVLLAAGPTVVGFGLINVSLSYLPSSVANLILTMEPVFTAIIAYILLGERFNGMQLTGSLTILAGVIVLRVHEGRLASQSQSGPRRRIRVNNSP